MGPVGLDTPQGLGIGEKLLMWIYEETQDYMVTD